MYYKIISAKYIKDYLIELSFQNNRKGIIDLKEYLGKGEVFKKFSDEEYFRQFYLQYGTLHWGNDEVDIAPETLYHKATGEPLPDWAEV